MRCPFCRQARWVSRHGPASADPKPCPICLGQGILEQMTIEQFIAGRRMLEEDIDALETQEKGDAAS